MTRLYLGSAAAAVLALIGGLGYTILTATASDPYQECHTTRVAGGTTQFTGRFTLTDSQTGATVTRDDVVTGPTLVYLGYTHCPDVCPLDNARNAMAVDILTETGHEVRPVFITVDPERDTAEVVRDFVGVFHPDMVGLTGTDEQVRAAARAFGALFNRQSTDDPYYLVDHTTSTYMMLPGQGVVGVFGREVRPERMAEAVACYVETAARL